jgi:hypothetical protein
MLTHMRAIERLAKRKRVNKTLLVPPAKRRDKMLSEHRGREAYRQLAAPPAWMDALAVTSLPTPRGKSDFASQAILLRTELDKLHVEELDLDNAEPYTGIGNDKRALEATIATLEDKMRLRLDQEHLLYAMSKKDLLKSANNLKFQRDHPLPSADEMRKASKTELIVLLTEGMGETMDTVLASAGYL